MGPTLVSGGEDKLATSVEPDAELDATGVRCPLPVLKARKRLASLAEGAVLRLRANDPAASLDVAHFCVEQGHKLLGEVREQGDVSVFDIRKGAGH